MIGTKIQPIQKIKKIHLCLPYFSTNDTKRQLLTNACFLLIDFVNKWINACRHHWVSLISFLLLPLFLRSNLEENKFSPFAFLRADIIIVLFKCQSLHAWSFNIRKLPCTQTGSLRDTNSMTIFIICHYDKCFQCLYFQLLITSQIFENTTV